MKLTVLNRTETRLPRSFIKRWAQRTAKKLKISADTRLTIVFLGRAASRKLNRQFRGKDSATDVLSFESVSDPSQKGRVLGELAICIPLVKAQARDHEITFNEELGYLVLHGILHLLGYEHERGGAAARRMFRLQDRLFEDLCSLESGATSKQK